MEQAEPAKQGIPLEPSLRAYKVVESTLRGALFELDIDAADFDVQLEEEPAKESPEDKQRREERNRFENWAFAEPKQVSWRIRDIDRDEAKPLTESGATKPPYEARAKTVEYDHCRVTVVVKNYRLELRDHDGQKEYVKDYSLPSVAILVERKDQSASNDVTGVYIGLVGVRQSQDGELERERDASEDTRFGAVAIKRNLLVYSNDTAGDKRRYQWNEITGIKHSDYPESTPPPEICREAEEGEVFYGTRVVSSMQRATKPGDSIVASSETMRGGVATKIYLYMHRYSPNAQTDLAFEGLKTLVPYVKNGEGIPDIEDKKFADDLEKGKAILAERTKGREVTLNPIGQLRVAIMNALVIASEQEAAAGIAAIRRLKIVIPQFNMEAVKWFAKERLSLGTLVRKPVLQKGITDEEETALVESASLQAQNTLYEKLARIDLPNTAELFMNALKAVKLDRFVSLFANERALYWGTLIATGVGIPHSKNPLTWNKFERIRDGAVAKIAFNRVHVTVGGVSSRLSKELLYGDAKHEGMFFFPVANSLIRVDIPQEVDGVIKSLELGMGHATEGEGSDSIAAAPFNVLTLTYVIPNQCKVVMAVAAGKSISFQCQILELNKEFDLVTKALVILNAYPGVVGEEEAETVFRDVQAASQDKNYAYFDEKVEKWVCRPDISLHRIPGFDYENAWKFVRENQELAQKHTVNDVPALIQKRFPNLFVGLEEDAYEKIYTRGVNALRFLIHGGDPSQLSKFSFEEPLVPVAAPGV